MRSSDELRDLSATETAALIRSRAISPLEVLDAAITRAEAARGLNPLVTETFERARARARSVDPSLPLAGVPFAVKDLAHVAGVPTAWGSRGANGFVPKKSEPFVLKLEALGLLSIGKSATPELGLTGTTEALLRGPCRNPWDRTRSVGGSSGGAACLVAAGVLPMAHASDGGGSIRIPAACAGLVGLKPTRGLIDLEGSNLLPVNIAVNGVVTRTVADQSAFYDAIGLAPARSACAKPPLRIGLFTTSTSGRPVANEVRDAIVAAGKLCESLGHRVEELACPFAEQDVDDFLSYWALVAWIQLRTARLMMSRQFEPSKVEPWTHGMANHFARQKLTVLRAVSRLRGFGRRYGEVMQRFDVIVNMVTADVPPKLGYLAPDIDFDTHFERLRTWLPVTGLWNAAGAPAITLPLGRNAQDLPIGIQFGAKPGDDRLLLELAATLEEAAPWPRVAPAERWTK
ncbi:MAG: amidase [Deltaproteobacteria bacterium]|nr:amidase [Deltaproteobacteria bacterium]